MLSDLINYYMMRIPFLGKALRSTDKDNKKAKKVEVKHKLPLKKRLFPKNKAKLFPRIYIYIVVLGLIIYLIYGLVPNLKACPFIFGETVCAPIGLYIMLFASFPGYLIIANILKFLPQIAWYVSFTFVIAVSFSCYYLLGKYFDKYSTKDDGEKLVIVIFTIFAVLLLIFLLLAL